MKVMDEIIEKFFKEKKANRGKLFAYGFAENENYFFYQKQIIDGEFKIVVKIKDNKVDASIYEIDTDEVYTLHLIPHAQGAFIGRVRHEYLSLLEDISQKCFEFDIFREDNTKKIIEFVKQEFNSSLEFLWPKFLNNAICRRRDNRKWFIVFMKTTADKIGLNKNNSIEIINLRVDNSKLKTLLDYMTFFPAYHMNKKSWITVKLNSVTNINQVYQLIRESFALALKNNQGKNNKLREG